MTDKLDDLDAVRTVVDTLSKFDVDTQERVIRWAREKLGLKTVEPSVATPHTHAKHSAAPLATEDAASSHKGRATDIKTFIASKNPSSNNEFTATVAYYYRFEAPEADRKDSITADDLQEACRQCDRDRLTKPAQTLVNAYHAGLIDRTDNGTYSINTVGENLVAMTLPSDQTIQRKNSAAHRKPSKKPVVKKAGNKKPKRS